MEVNTILRNAGNHLQNHTANSPEYITPSSHRPKNLKYVKQVLFLYERSSVYTPTHGLARASRLFVPLSTDTRTKMQNGGWQRPNP